MCMCGELNPSFVCHHHRSDFRCNPHYELEAEKTPQEERDAAVSEYTDSVVLAAIMGKAA